jgi:hypothetical protein
MANLKSLEVAISRDTRPVQFKTGNFGYHCQYTLKKSKIGFTLLTSMVDIPLT